MRKKVKIKRLDEDVPKPEYQTEGAIGFDIAANEKSDIEPGKVEVVSTGLVVCVPDELGLFLTPRSSNVKKRLSMANCIGVIDHDYCGPEDELFIALYNIGNSTYSVEKGERIAQGFFTPMVKAEFTEEDWGESKNRGGFGTTG